MLDMSSIKPILTTPSEILLFSSEWAAHIAANRSTALDTIASDRFIVTSRVVDALTRAIPRIGPTARGVSSDLRCRRRWRRGRRPICWGRGASPMTIKGKAYIAGIFEHPTRLAPDKPVAQLHAEVALGALADAGLTRDDVDGYFCSGDAPGPGPGSMAEYMNLKLRRMDSTEIGGASYITLAAHAAEAIAQICAVPPEHPQNFKQKPVLPVT